MKLKSFKAIHFFVVVSSSVLLMACNSKTTAPLSLMSSSANIEFNEAHQAKDNSNLVENYGVKPAHSVSFSKNADEQTKDFSY
jgi:hypothetical protein